jgi:1,4-alpha-glucan branching enzyme
MTHEFPDVMTMAEESMAWPMVSRPWYAGGLGFGFKWDTGWRHDMLRYAAYDPLVRSYHQNLLIFSLMYGGSGKGNLAAALVDGLPARFAGRGRRVIGAAAQSRTAIV